MIKSGLLLWSAPGERQVCVCMLSHFSHVPLFQILWTVARQVSLFMGCPRQEYWRGLPCPPPLGRGSSLQPWTPPRHDNDVDKVAILQLTPPTHFPQPDCPSLYPATLQNFQRPVSLYSSLPSHSGPIPLHFGISTRHLITPCPA